MPEVTRVYLRHRYEDLVRKALEHLGDWIEETVSSEQEPGEVVQIDAVRA
jgi:hypothetical protein